MIKKEQRLEAVHHARKYFTAAEPDQMEDIQKVMALLGENCSWFGQSVFLDLDSLIWDYRCLSDNLRFFN